MKYTGTTCTDRAAIYRRKVQLNIDHYDYDESIDHCNGIYNHTRKDGYNLA